MPTQLSPMLELALSYAGRGLPIFPCRSRETPDPDTGEIYGAKTPLTPNGLKGATTTERIIRVWWERNPDAMIGLPTGSKAGFFVLDLDVKPGVGDGHEWLDDMESEHGPLPHTARVRTMGGGTHIFFKHVNGVRNRGGLGVCVDVRGDGGYIVAPGSVAADGRMYEWMNDTSLDHVADAPRWLLDLLLPPARPERTYTYEYQPFANEPYANAAFEAECRNLATTGVGGRGYQVNASAYSIGQLVGAGVIDRSQAEDGLWHAAVACGIVAKDGEREIKAKIKRGLDAGQQQPRAIPERAETPVDNTTLRSIQNIINSASKKPAMEPANHDEETAQQSENHTQTLDNKPATPTADPDLIPGTTAAAEAIFATPFKWIDPKTLPRREFAFGTHYIRKYVSVTVSPGGLGKTSNSIVEALSMASGRALAGVKPPQRLRVWLFNAEDPRDEMERRIMAACLHYKLSPADIEGHLFLDSGREQELVVMKEDKKTGVMVNVPIVQAVVANIERHGIDVMVVDPFVSTHGVNENDNGAIDKVAKLWAQIADHTNCAVDVVHHLRKVSDREATVEDARGAVALIGAARSVRVLNRMSEDQATKAGIEPEARFGYFSVTYGKSNLTPLSHRLDWRRLESVPLGNGRGLTKPQDHAPVVTEWKWPSKEEVAESIPDDVRRAVVVRLGNQNYRESPQSADWAGYVVAEAMGVHLATGKEMTTEKRRIKSALDAWIDSGVLAVIEEPNPKHIGRTIKFVRPA